MFCPKCRYEYVEGVKFCGDCGEKLVAELPPLKADMFKDFPSMVFTRVRDPYEEEILLSALREKGIECAAIQRPENSPNGSLREATIPAMAYAYGVKRFFEKDIVINADKFDQAKEVLIKLREEMGL